VPAWRAHAVTLLAAAFLREPDFPALQEGFQGVWAPAMAIESNYRMVWR